MNWKNYFDSINAGIPQDRDEKFYMAPPECFWHFRDKNLKKLNKFRIGQKIAITVNDFFATKKVYHLATIIAIDFIWIGYQIDQSNLKPDWLTCDDTDIQSLISIVNANLLGRPRGFKRSNSEYVSFVKNEMQKHKETIAPVKIFNTIPLNLRPKTNPFRVGMKFIAYDNRPNFIHPEGVRAVTVFKTDGNAVHMYFDGVEGKNSIWVECYDSRYFFPIGFEKELGVSLRTKFFPSTNLSSFRSKLISMCWPDILPLVNSRPKTSINLIAKQEITDKPCCSRNNIEESSRQSTSTLPFERNPTEVTIRFYEVDDVFVAQGLSTPKSGLHLENQRSSFNVNDNNSQLSDNFNQFPIQNFIETTKKKRSKWCNIFEPEADESPERRRRIENQPICEIDQNTPEVIVIDEMITKKSKIDGLKEGLDKINNEMVFGSGVE